MRTRTTATAAGDRQPVTMYQVPARGAAPQAIRLAVGLGRLLGRGINGQTGTIRYGYPTEGTRARYSGYAFPPQLFTGYSPLRIAGTAMPSTPAYPSATTPAAALGSPLEQATARITGR